MNHLEKIQKMPEKKKRVFAMTSAIVITLIVVIFTLVLNSLLSSRGNTRAKGSIFDSGQMKELKDNFVNVFNK